MNTILVHAEDYTIIIILRVYNYMHFHYCLPGKTALLENTEATQMKMSLSEAMNGSANCVSTSLTTLYVQSVVTSL